MARLDSASDFISKLEYLLLTGRFQFIEVDISQISSKINAIQLDLFHCERVHYCSHKKKPHISPRV
ncbi:CEL_1a_G0014690.mRNA.1.CDS.1 [Saccharomyces cerevisiae]|nr:CEL_1a_G0014690.mRNA.1.CDS.1 [Saccharomyces cerevisiae]CAI7256355.1 CEL_1a_G0014690.mRNA.1.CDS.1 [Saccharomyces cerevisiae]